MGGMGCIAVKPGSVAERDGQVQPGMLLGYIGGEWVQGLDYLDQITMIRDVSPVDSADTFHSLPSSRSLVLSLSHPLARSLYESQAMACLSRHVSAGTNGN